MITFHRILAGCEAGDPESWRAFLADYEPVVFQLFEVYLPSSSERRSELAQEALRALAANHFEPLRTFDHQAEREFLADLRTFVLEQGAAKLNQDRGGAPGPAPDA